MTRDTGAARMAARGGRSAPVFCSLLLLPLTVFPADRTGRGPPPAEPAPEPKREVTTREKKAQPSDPHELDTAKLPDNTIIFVSESVKEALRLVPRAVVLAPTKYQELLDRIADLERKLKAKAPRAPSTCKLKALGSLDGDLVNLRAEFTFEVKKGDPEAPGRISLGCKGANPKKAELDGKEAALETGDDGFEVTAAPGPHTVALELELPVVSRGRTLLGGEPDRGFEVNLPRAAITTLELEQLPAGAKEVRANGLALRQAGEALGLGPAERLAVTWKKPPAAGGNGALLTAEGKITVQAEEKGFLVEADLTLQDARGQTRAWVLGTPAGTSLEVVPAGGRESAAAVDVTSSNRDGTEHTVRLKEPGVQALRVLLRARQPRTAGRTWIAPFRLLNAERFPNTVILREGGTLLVKKPAEVRLAYVLPPREGRVQVSGPEPSEKPGQDLFTYRILPPAPSRPAPGRPTLLGLEVKTVQGVVETRVDHALVLRKGDQGWEVEITSRIQALPRWKAVDSLDVQLPRDWPEALAVFTAWPRPGMPVSLAVAAGLRGGRDGPWWPFASRYELKTVFLRSAPVETVQVGDGRRARIVLADRLAGEYTLVLRGVYQLPRGGHRVRLELPRPLQTLDRGGRVELTADPAAGGQQLWVREGGVEVPAPEVSRYQASSETAPSRLEFAWRPYRPDLPLRVEADVTLEGRTASVRQRLEYPDRGRWPDAVTFRLPAGGGLPPRTADAVARSLRVLSGGFQLEGFAGLARAAPLTWRVIPDPKGRAMELAYDFPLPARGPVRVPLLWPDRGTRVETKVRVWSEPGAGPETLAALQGGAWRVGKTEVVPGRARLPVLVLHGSGRNLPLTLRLSRSAGPPLASALVQRGLIRVVLGPSGRAVYRAGFLVRQWNTRVLAVELPPGARLNDLRLDGKAVVPQGVGGGPAVRFRLAVDPDRYGRPVLLEMTYETGLEGAGAEAPENSGLLQTLPRELSPPVLRGAVYLGRVRWLVAGPPGQVVLNPGGGATLEQRWGMHGWLLAPRPALTGAELENWLAGRAGAAGAETGEADLLCWQVRPGSLYLVQVPWKTWLLGCSGLLLALGLGLSFVPAAHGPLRLLCWSAVVLVCLAAAAALLWPGVLPAVVYGCEPGAVVLVVVLTAQWTLHRRYRRQLVFMPGFARAKPGSGLTRGSSHRTREASTVDGPTQPEQGSGVRSAGPG